MEVWLTSLVKILSLYKCTFFIKYKYIILLFLGGFIFVISCNTSSNKKIKENQVFDELAYLERFNTKDIIYINTPSYVKLLEKNDVGLIVKNRTDLLETNFEDYLYKPAKIIVNIKNDTFFLSKIEYRVGKCMNFHPYLEFKETRCNLLSPEIINGGVSISNGDTAIWETSCELATIVEIVHIIPVSIVDNKKLYFEGKEISYN